MSLETTLLIAGGVFVGGILTGAGVAHAWYKPQLEAANLKVESMGETIRVQNRGVAQLKTQGDKLQKQAAKAADEGKKGIAQAEADVQLLLMSQPGAGEDRCTAASALMRRELAK